MKVLVLGAGVIGTACAYYLTKAGHEVVVVDRQSGPALENQLRQCRRRVPEFRRSLGRARHAIEGRALAVRRPCTADAASALRPASMAMAGKLPWQLLRGTLRAQQGAHAAHRALQ